MVAGEVMKLFRLKNKMPGRFLVDTSCQSVSHQSTTRRRPVCASSISKNILYIGVCHALDLTQDLAVGCLDILRANFSWISAWKVSTLKYNMTSLLRNIYEVVSRLTSSRQTKGE